MRNVRALIGSLGLGLIFSLAHGQITESPETVAPGHYLLEMDALSLTIDHVDGGRYTGIGAANTLFTTGLSENLDLQLGLEIFLSQKYDLGGATERHRGVGDLYVRAKWRLYKDAATGTAVAVLPYVKIPTNTGGMGSHAIEGGVIFPCSVSLPGSCNLGAMAEADFLHNDGRPGYAATWYGSMAMSRQVTKIVGLYAELAAGKPAGGARWAGVAGGGVTLAVSENCWWDLAVYRGISPDAADWNPVLRFNFGF